MSKKVALHVSVCAIYTVSVPSLFSAFIPLTPYNMYISTLQRWVFKIKIYRRNGIITMFISTQCIPNSQYPRDTFLTDNRISSKQVGSGTNLWRRRRRSRESVQLRSTATFRKMDVAVCACAFNS